MTCASTLPRSGRVLSLPLALTYGLEPPLRGLGTARSLGSGSPVPRDGGNW